MEKIPFSGKKVARLITYVVSLVLVCVISSLLTVQAMKRKIPVAIMRTGDLIHDRFYYYEDLIKDDTLLVQGAIRGMVATMEDPYAAYFTEEEYTALVASNSGAYEGLGVVVYQNGNGECIIQKIYAGSNADIAGMLPGDVLVSVNGTRTEGFSSTEISPLLLDGTENEIIVQRDGEMLLFSVRKGPVSVPYAVHEVMEDGTGYLQITEFHGNVVTEVEAALHDFLDRNVDHIIIDLRENPGGTLDAIVGVADCFLEKGKLITSFDSKGEKEEYYFSTKAALYTGRIAVLVNGHTASAAELMTGCLKDYGLAVIIGTTTFGKGIVQTTYGLGDRQGYVKLTTAAYYTPNHICVHGIGIEPDIQVDQNERFEHYAPEMIPHEEDTQLLRALEVLKGE